MKKIGRKIFFSRKQGFVKISFCDIKRTFEEVLGFHHIHAFNSPFTVQSGKSQKSTGIVGSVVLHQGPNILLSGFWQYTVILSCNNKIEKSFKDYLSL